MSLLGGYLGPALTALTNTVGGFQQGQIKGDQIKQQRLQAQIAQKRQEKEDQIKLLVTQQKMAHEGKMEKLQSIKSGPGGQLVDLSDPNNPKNVGPAPVVKPVRDPVADAIRVYDYKRQNPMPGKGPKNKPIPPAAVDKLAGIDNLVSQATDVVGALDRSIKNNTNATGRVFGVIPTPAWAKNAANMGGNEGRDIRALIGNLFSSVAKERGGTALSEQEINRLETFLPNENEDEAVALIKANRFIKTLKQMKADKLKAYQQYGYGNGQEAPDEDEVRDPILEEYGLE